MRRAMLLGLGLAAAASASAAVAHQAVALVAPAPAPGFDLAEGKRAVAVLAEELERTFVFPDVARRYAARLRERLADGAYDRAADAAALAAMVTEDLQAVAPDGHLKMRPPLPAAAEGGPARRRVYPDPMEQAGWIADGVAYVRFNAFLGSAQQVADFEAFLDGHEGARTLIIDARTHHGGGLSEMDVLFPRIFTEPRTVMVMDTRASVAAEEGGLPFDSLVQVPAPAELHRAEHRVVPRAERSAWADTRIFLLTSGRTASAAEHLATVLKETGRATLIGDTTAGAGNYGGGIDLPGGYDAFIPVGHSYFPGKQGWEGVGVTPHIAVAPERALVEALVRSGVSAQQAEALSASHVPGEPMVRRRPLRS